MTHAETLAWRRWREGLAQRFDQQHERNQRVWSGRCPACGMAVPVGEHPHRYRPATEAN